MCQEVTFSLVWSISKNVGLPVTNLGSSQKGQLPYNGKSISAKFDVISLPKCAHPKYQMHIPIIPNTHPGITNTKYYKRKIQNITSGKYKILQAENTKYYKRKIQNITCIKYKILQAQNTKC